MNLDDLEFFATLVVVLDFDYFLELEFMIQDNGDWLFICLAIPLECWKLSSSPNRLICRYLPIINTPRSQPTYHGQKRVQSWENSWWIVTSSSVINWPEHFWRQAWIGKTWEALVLVSSYYVVYYLTNIQWSSFPVAYSSPYASNINQGCFKKLLELP